MVLNSSASARLRSLTLTSADKSANFKIYPMLKAYQPIKFPADESAHDFIVEWWYFNGHLKDKLGQEYSFMNCLFKVDVKKVKIPFLSKIPLKTSYFSHSLISDLKNKKFYHKISPFSILADDSFSKPLLYINYLNPEIKSGYTNCAIEKTAKSAYRLKNENLDLALTSKKDPLLLGGNGFLNLQTKTTYYYSLTSLRATGRLKIENQWLEVAGQAWFDHQWADTSYSKDRWDWFSLQLSDQTEIVCFMYDNGRRKTYLADISYPDNRQEHYENLKIIPGQESWTSPKSRAVYPLAWKIKIPAKNLELNLTARIDNQEMLFGPINYWEGPLTVSGRFGQKNVAGLGFMELVGYPSEYSNVKYIRDEIGETIGRFMATSKSRARNLIGHLKK
jgi:predicted secreted hydrolase